MIRWITSWVIILIVGFAIPAVSQEFEASEFETFIDETMSASTVPGLAVILFDNDAITYANAFGIADNENSPVTLDTPFQVASVSKSFTSLLIVQLAAEGQLDLDGPIINYLPSFRTADSEAWQAITVRHVLSHRSGLSTLDGNRLQSGNYRGTDALERAVKTLRKAKLTSTPGQQLEYSNANYMIAAAMIESLTGQRFETVMTERIFKPLGMNHSYVQVSNGADLKESMGFRQWFGIPVAQRSIPGRAYMGAGGVTTSAKDLAVYVKAIANKDTRIVPAQLADDLTSPQGNGLQDEEQYGLGWMLYDINEDKFVHHAGLNGGFTAHVGFFSKGKRGGVVLVNQSGMLQADVAGAVLRKGLGIPTGASRPSKGQHMTIWGMLATAAVLAFSFILSTLRFSAYARRVKHVNVFRRVLPALGLFALAFFLAFMIPRMQGITLSGLKVFFPDIWLCLAISALISVLWGLTRLIYPVTKI